MGPHNNLQRMHDDMDQNTVGLCVHGSMSFFLENQCVSIITLPLGDYGTSILKGKLFGTPLFGSMFSASARD